jgi:hypothetical protein
MRSAVTRFFVALLALATIREARAADAPKSVKIDVQVISATTGNAGVDPRLEKIRKNLSEFKYSSYQVISEKTVGLSMNSKETVQLPEKYVLELTPKSIEPNGMIRVHLNVRSEKQAKLVDTEYAIAPGKDLVVGGMKQKDGALLVALHHRAEK